MLTQQHMQPFCAGVFDELANGARHEAPAATPSSADPPRAPTQRCCSGRSGAKPGFTLWRRLEHACSPPGDRFSQPGSAIYSDPTPLTEGPDAGQCTAAPARHWRTTTPATWRSIQSSASSSAGMAQAQARRMPQACALALAEISTGR